MSVPNVNIYVKYILLKTENFQFSHHEDITVVPFLSFEA